MKTRPRSKTADIDAYLAGLSEDKRAALEKLRKSIHAIVPEAEECISYQLPAFRFNGKMLLWFGAGANHCALYPGGIVEEFKDDLINYQTSKGTIRFQPEKPLPVGLIRKLIRACIAKNS